ncbi:MAG: hypothetical protein K6C36_08000 [Clostridia bacterium]|nr:hypothetical protein [Clostridia bacterium]
MDRFIDFINASLPDADGDAVLFKFKKKTYDEMLLRRDEAAGRGICNQKVIDDLIVSEYPDLRAEYAVFRNKEAQKNRDKRNAKLNALGSAIYILALILFYLLISFLTGSWGTTWAIIVDGILLWVDYLLLLGVIRVTKMKKIFHIFARMMLAGLTIIFSVAVYIFVVALTDLPRSWVIVMFGLILMFVCDAAYALIARHRLAIFTCLTYVPVIAVFAFVIVGALGLLPWGVAWMIIPLSLVIDLIVIFISIAKNAISKAEVTEEWNEN